MTGLTNILPSNLPSDLPYWLKSFGLNTFFGTTIGASVTVKYALHTTGLDPRDEAYRALSAGEIANIERSLEKIAFETGLTFVETADAEANLLIGATSDPSSTVYGRTWQFTGDQPVQVIAYDAVYSSPDGLANNSYIYIHELLHAVGLAHSTRAFGSTLPDVIPDDEDNGTTLFGSWHVGWDGGTQMFDVAVLQFLYGPDATMRSGDDVYVPIFAAYDVSTPRQDQPLLWDGAGYDTINLISALGGAVASLAPGVISQVNTTNTGILEAGTFSINYNSVFEKLIGTNFDDVLSGHTGDEEIIGRKGNDTIRGGDGADHLKGSQGRDVLFGDKGGDQIDGGKGGDTIRGGVGADTINGGSGRDRIWADKGADTLTGGAGADKFNFRDSKASGNNQILDFEDGIDLIRFVGNLAFDDLDISASGADTVIAWHSGQVTLLNIAQSQITEDDFIFV